ncbi:hypothetical protein GE061_012727 [Apolygus lucorum]|uniref:Uncharacterized protein n=1 Tax=Apolygus lucorum TaxID=248454 RepID=A0A8S9XVT3_APOLU|nr:hypothetical protein GE061_012727 [Apolygus lucorum]
MGGHVVGKKICAEGVFHDTAQPPPALSGTKFKNSVEEGPCVSKIRISHFRTTEGITQAPVLPFLAPFRVFLEP